jgi:HK97 family phage prohead protease
MMATVRTMGSEARYVAEFECRAEADGRYIDLVATTYENPVDIGPFIEVMTRGVFDETLSRRSDNIKLLVGHDHGAPSAVGTPVEWRKGDTELGVTYRFGNHAEAQEIAARAADGMFGGCSVSFLPGKKDGDNQWSDDKRHVRRNRARLLEVSLVTVPANADARLVAVRTAGAPGIVPTPRIDLVRAMLEQRAPSVLD